MFEQGLSKNEINKVIKERCPKLEVFLLKRFKVKNLYSLKIDLFYRVLFGVKIPNCPVCNKPTGYDVGLRKYNVHCSKACVNKSPEVKAKREQTNVKRFGTKNAFASESIKDKIKQTNLTKYGVENPSQSNKVKAKKRNTSLKHWGVPHHMQSAQGKQLQQDALMEKYGVSNPRHIEGCLEKMRNTLLEKYGVTDPNDVPGAKQKRLNSYITTCLKRYGVTNAIHNLEILGRWRSAVASKDVADINGTKVSCQGYEKYVLEYLNAKRQFKRIATSVKNVKTIPYVHEGVKRKYLPDAKIMMQDGSVRYLEVKGWFTLKNETNISKFKAAYKYCKDRNATFWLAIADPNNNHVLCFPVGEDGAEHFVKAAEHLSKGKRNW